MCELLSTLPLINSLGTGYDTFLQDFFDCLFVTFA